MSLVFAKRLASTCFSPVGEKKLQRKAVDLPRQLRCDEDMRTLACTRTHALKAPEPANALQRRAHDAARVREAPSRRQQEAEPESLLACANCLHRITSERERMAVNDRHDQEFVNPAGYLFRIGCFRAAPGCAVRGTPTFEFTWFSGFAWSYALCGACGQHLGWRYESAASSFFGLILNRLVSAQ